MNKATLIILIFLLTANLAFGQTDTGIHFTLEYDEANNDKFLKDQNIIQPSYHGGLAKLEEYIQENLTYSKKDKKNGLVGINYIQLKIGTDAKILSASFIKSTIPPKTMSKILKLLLSCHDWNPATKDGEPTEVYLWLIMNYDNRQ